jgi:hypothetical protein
VTIDAEESTLVEPGDTIKVKRPEIGNQQDWGRPLLSRQGGGRDPEPSLGAPVGLQRTE